MGGLRIPGFFTWPIPQRMLRALKGPPATFWVIFQKAQVNSIVESIMSRILDDAYCFPWLLEAHSLMQNQSFLPISRNFADKISRIPNMNIKFFLFQPIFLCTFKFLILRAFWCSFYLINKSSHIITPIWKFKYVILEVNDGGLGAFT